MSSGTIQSASVGRVVAWIGSIAEAKSQTVLRMKKRTVSTLKQDSQENLHRRFVHRILLMDRKVLLRKKHRYGGSSVAFSDNFEKTSSWLGPLKDSLKAGYMDRAIGKYNQKVLDKHHALDELNKAIRADMAASRAAYAAGASSTKKTRTPMKMQDLPSEKTHALAKDM
jgi:hypothetical protein